MIIALILVLTVLVVLNQKGKINYSKLAVSTSVIVLMAFLSGLYLFEFLRSIVSFFLTAVNDTRYEEAVNKLAFSSNVGRAINLVLLVTFAVPFVIGMIYLFLSMIRKPLKRDTDEDKNRFNLRCAKRMCTLGIISAALFFVLSVISVVMIIPWLETIWTSVMLMSPIVIGFLLIFGGIMCVVVLAEEIVLLNVPVLILLIIFSCVCLVTYILSVIFGVCASARAAKSNTVTIGKGLLYGLLSFMGGWNIIVFILLNGKIKEHLNSAD